MLTGPSPFQSKGKLLAKWLTAMWNAIKAQRVTVVPNRGLAFNQTPDGLRITFNPPEATTFALITTLCPKLNTTGMTMTPGAGTLYTTTKAANGVKTLVSTGQTNVPIYNPGNYDVAVTRRIRVEQLQGDWVVANEYCP